MNTSTVMDQMERKVTIHTTNPSIISLVPSMTEYLIDLGVRVVGRTKFCIHPEENIREIPVIGGTKNFRFEKIRDLKPDLIVGNKEENYPDGIQRLQEEFPVWMSDIEKLEDATEMMHSLSVLLNSKKGPQFIKKVENTYKNLKNSRSGRVLYLIWQNPFMAVGASTFIDNFLNHLGYENVIRNVRYPEISIKEIHELNPEYIFLSSEPFPFSEKHRAKMEKEFPVSDVRIVDGEFYSWYGTRILKKKSLIDQNAY